MQGKIERRSAKDGTGPLGLGEAARVRTLMAPCRHSECRVRIYKSWTSLLSPPLSHGLALPHTGWDAHNGWSTASNTIAVRILSLFSPFHRPFAAPVNQSVLSDWLVKT